MNLIIEDLGEPDLEFGNGECHKDPKSILPIAGPFSSSQDIEPRTIQLGLVGLPGEIDPVRRWITRMHGPLISEESNALRFREFPGAKTAFRCTFDIPDRFIRRINQRQYDLNSSRHPNDRFSEMLRLYKDAISTLFGDQRPECVLVCFSEELASFRVSNPRLTYQEQRFLERLQYEEETGQGLLFEPTPEEKRAAAELLPQAEELLFRNFHRALKAACMSQPNSVPLQVLRRQTYIDRDSKQSPATRAWNLGLALYYKSGNIPWRPATLKTNTCFVGVSFHHLKRRSGDLVYASVAQAFSANSEPFALKGAAVPRDQARGKQPYLREEQAATLMEDIINEYEKRIGSFPARVIVHKTSRYQPEEEEGFRKGLLSKVAGCELVWIAPTGFRLIRRGMLQPLNRGTLCTVERESRYLFTTGYVPWWKIYPGPHIPAPVELGAAGETNFSERAQEILSLTKMNWNSADGVGRFPITLSFARRVGTIMTELDEDTPPNPLYRFYM